MNLISVFEILFLIFLVLYLFQQIVFLIGFYKKPRIIHDYNPFVSVLVAARNEEKNILNCLNSLNNLNYDKEKLEIIVIDDYSTDQTSRIIDEYIFDKPYFKKINPEKNIAKLSGKANAIANGIEIANGEIIFTTDADCTVSPDWIKHLVNKYDENTGIVTGFTLQKSYSIFSAIQNLDWVFLLTVAAGTINLGLPLSCIGNNMSYRKKSYEKVGGYKNLKFSVTEDFALLHAIHRKNKEKIWFETNPASLVMSEPCKTWKELIRQKHRWSKGGLDSRIEGFIVMGIGFVLHLFMLLQLLFFSYTTLFFSLIKILTDFFFVLLPLSNFRRQKEIKYFIFFELYFIFYVLIIPFLVLFIKNVYWKERKY